MKLGLMSCGIALVWLATLSCRSAPGEPPRPPVDFEVEWSGCASVMTGPVCELDAAATLHLWTAAPGGPQLSVELDRQQMHRRLLPLHGGFGVEVKVEPTSQLLEVVSPNGARWSLPLRQQRVAEAVRKARALRADGRNDEVLAALTDAGLEPRDAARAESIRGRVSLSRGELELAVTQLAAAQSMHRRLGAVSDEVNDAFVVGYSLVQAHQLAAAEAAIDSVNSVLAAYPEGAAQADYYRALSARRAGDLRRARRLLTEAERRATRLGLTRQLGAIDQVMGVLHAQLGEYTAALRRFEQQGAPGPPEACDRAMLALNLAWAHQLAADAGAPAEPREPILVRALELFEGKCPRPLEAANVRAHLALLALERNELGAAEEQSRLAHAAGATKHTRIALWWLDIDGRIALGRRRAPRAMQQFRRLELLADASVDSAAKWRALKGQAETLLAMGEKAAALAMAMRAEDELDSEGLRTPVDGGLESLLDTKDGSARLAVVLLLELGRPDEAFAVARHARARALRWEGAAARLSSKDASARARWLEAEGKYHAARATLDADAVDDWKRPADEMRSVRASRATHEAAVRHSLEAALAALGAPPSAPAAAIDEGTVMVFAFPTLSGWVSFGATSKGVRAAQFTAPAISDSAGWAAALLLPFDDELRRASEVVVLPYGVVRQLDVHALPWQGEPLLARLPVRYSLDLGRVAASEPAAAAQWLVVGDPRSDLPYARAEALEVAQRVPSRTLLLGQQARVRAVRDAMAQATALHFAGHASAEGTSGWEAELELADGRMLAADVLALARVPALVVLSGCDTAHSAPRGVEPFGLAHAFLTAGAGAVIATTRPVADAQAQQLVSALYQGGALDETNAATRLQRAATAQFSLGRGWESFRVLTP